MVGLEDGSLLLDQAERKGKTAIVPVSKVRQAPEQAVGIANAATFSFFQSTQHRLGLY